MLLNELNLYDRLHELSAMQVDTQVDDDLSHCSIFNFTYTHLQTIMSLVVRKCDSLGRFNVRQV